MILVTIELRKVCYNIDLYCVLNVNHNVVIVLKYGNGLYIYVWKIHPLEDLRSGSGSAKKTKTLKVFESNENQYSAE